MAWETGRRLQEAARRTQAGVAERSADLVQRHLDSLFNVLSIIRRGAGDAGLWDATMNGVPGLEDLALYGPDGRPGAALHRRRRHDFAPLAAAARAEAARAGFYRGPVEIDADGVPRICLGVPAERGVLLARVNLWPLRRVLAGVDPGPGGRLVVRDAAGRGIAESGASDDVSSGARLTAAAAVGDTGWTVTVEQPAAVVLAAATALRRRVVWSLVLAALFAAAAAGFLGRRVARPLEGFLHVVRRLRDGMFDSLIEVRSDDELGEIAAALREAQPALEKRVRDALLGRMARFLGHDLRQPLQGVRRSLETVTERLARAPGVADDPAVIRHFRVSFESLDWADAFIEDLLTVGRDRPLALREVDAGELLARARERVSSTEGAAVTLRDGAAGVRLNVDDGEMMKALVNALKNAREAAGPRGTVELAAGREGDAVYVEIVDDGPGFPPEKRDRLFEEWTSKSSGSGLGLLVMKRVVDRHGGRIVIGDAPGGGAVVRFYLPAVGGLGVVG
jgi:signal transduction histidine kinase